MPALVDEGRLLLGRARPQHEDDRIRFRIDDADDSIGEPLPPAVTVRGGAAHFDRQHAVQEQYALGGPMFEADVASRSDAEVAFQLLEDVDEARWRPDFRRHREAQAVRLALAVIGVL